MSNKKKPFYFWVMSAGMFVIIGGLLAGMFIEYNSNLQAQCEALGGTFNSNRGAAICFAPGIVLPLKKN